MPRATQLMGMFALMLTCPFQSPSHAAELNAECLRSLVRNLSSCFEPVDGLFDNNQLIRSNIARLIFLCSAESTDTQAPVLQVLGAKLYSNTMWMGETAGLLAGADMSVNYTTALLPDWIWAPETDVVNALAHGDVANSHHLWLLNPAVVGAMVELDALQDLSQLVASDTGLEWSDVHPYYRTASANYGGQVLMLPIDGAMWVMYVRHDVLAAHSLAVPTTWEDLIHAAALVNGTDMNGDGANDTAICFSTCLTSYMIISIWASIVQTHGLQQGMNYDVLTMQPMVNTTSFAYALQLFQRMYPYALPTHNTGSFFNLTAFLSGECITYQPIFSDGGCAFTFGWSTQFKRNSYDGNCVPGSRFPGSSCAGVDTPRFARGRTTTVPLPGSRLVFDRVSQTLEPCTPALCPFATLETGMDGVTALVNTAPYSAYGGAAGAINKFSSGAYQFFAYSFVSLFCKPGLSTFNLLDPLAEAGPFRLSQLDEDLMQAKYNVSWKSAGYEASDVESFLRTTNAALVHPNLAMDLRLSTAKTYWSITVFAAMSVTAIGTPVATMMKQVSLLLRSITPTTSTALVELQRKYWISLNFALRPPPPPGLPGSPPQPPLLASLAPASGAAFFSEPRVAGPVLASSGLTLALFIAAFVYGFHVQRLRHKSLWGRVLAPKAGPATTLLVTDIEGSTTLWETFDDAYVMDAALRLHHAVIRRLLVEHSGYETATEGDSFIVAFHSAGKALQFAVDAQLTLLHAAWPMELDAAPASSRVWSVQAGGVTCEERSTVKGLTRRSRSSSISGTETQLGGSARLLALKTRAGVGASMSFDAFPAACNVHSALAALQPTSAESGGHPAVAAMVHCGLRVRIGMHTGVLNLSEVSVNAASGRITFSGEPLVLAKAVADAAHGGQVLCSETSHADLWKSTSEQMSTNSDCMVWHAGLHELNKDLPPLHIYTAFPRALLPRIALFPPLRSIAQRLPGVLEVPLGRHAVSFVTLSGARVLQDWDLKEATHAVSVFQACCAAAAEQCAGFVMDLGVGEMVGVFSDCTAAVAWSLDVIEAMKSFSWSETLLSHPLCEDLSVFGEPPTAVASLPVPPKGTGKHRRQTSGLKPRPSLTQPPPAAPQQHCQLAGQVNTGFTAVFHPTTCGLLPCGPIPDTEDSIHGRNASMSEADGGRRTPSEAARLTVGQLLFHGPRVRVGVAIGDVAVDIPNFSAAGRPVLRGRAVTLAARIAEAALSSEVLCSSEVCNALEAGAATSQSSASAARSGITCMLLPGRGVPLHQETVDLYLYLCRSRNNVRGLLADHSERSSWGAHSQGEAAAEGASCSRATLGVWGSASSGGSGGSGNGSGGSGGGAGGGGGLRKAISLSFAKATLASLIGRSTLRTHAAGGSTELPLTVRVRLGSAPGIPEVLPERTSWGR